jgi:membrane protease subunit HflC
MVFVFFLVNSVFIINEKEQAIITQFGKPIGSTIVQSGLKFKIPFIHTVLRFDRRILEWDGSVNEIPTKDNKYILIDTFAKWKISDALEFYKSAKNEMMAQSRLDDIIDGAVRDEIANRSMSEIVKSSDRVMDVNDSGYSENRDGYEEEYVTDGARLEIISDILYSVDSKLKELKMGIEIVDVQIKRVSYNKQVQNKLFNRMISEQSMIAEKYRAQGQGSKQEILGRQIQKEKEVKSNAYLSSQNIKGKADAEATEIYAKSYSQSPEFYNYLKTLETYKKTLDPSTVFILSTDNKYLKFLE